MIKNSVTVPFSISLAFGSLISNSAISQTQTAQGIVSEIGACFERGADPAEWKREKRLAIYGDLENRQIVSAKFRHRAYPVVNYRASGKYTYAHDPSVRIEGQVPHDPNAHRSFVLEYVRIASWISFFGKLVVTSGGSQSSFSVECFDTDTYHSFGK